MNLSCCLGCRLRQLECVCAESPRLAIATRLIVVIHTKEWRRTTNTGHLARLAIQGAEVRLHGSPKRKISSAGIVSEPSSTLVLYPGRGAEPLTRESVEALPRPLTLLIPDGNWNQAQHMMRRLPLLSRARPVCLPGSNLHLPGLRRNGCAGRMSTFEAIAQAIGILEGDDPQARLLTFFKHYLTHATHNSRRSHRHPANTRS